MLLSYKESNLSPGAPGWLRRRIMWPVFIGLMLATLVTAFVYISLLIHGSQQELAYNSAGMAAKWETDLYHHERTLNALGSGLSESQNLRLALQSRDRNRLIELVTPLFEFYKKHYSIDTLALIDHERRVVHRFHDAENHGDRVGFATIMAAEASGQAATGIDFGSNGRLVQRTVTPVYDQGRLLGYVVIGESMTVLLKHLDEAFVVRHMAVIDKAAIQQQKLVVKIAKDGKVQPIDIERFPAHVLIDQSVGTIPLSVQEKLQQGSLGTLNSGDIVSGAKYYYAVSKMPIRSGDETSLGFVLALRDITVQRQELINAVILASSIPFVVMAGLFIILYGVTSRTESRMNVAYRELQENREQVELGQKYWNDAFNAIKEPVFIHDAEFRVVRANQAYAQLAGMKIQEMIGRRYYHCYPKSDKPMPECVEALQSNLYDEDEHETTTPDGKIYLSRGFVTRNRQGHYLHSVHIMVDVSRDREKEKLVRDTAARLSSIMRAVPAGVGLLVNRVITYVNENVCVITGYKNEELVGQSSRVLYADDAEFERVGRVKYAAIAKSGTGEIETVMRRKDGRMINVILRSSAIDIHDLSQGVTFTMMDVTEHRARDKALKEREEIFSALVNNLPHVVFMKDRESRYLLVNRRYADDLGVTPEEMVGKTDMDFHPAEIAGKYRTDDDAVMRKDEIQEIEEEYHVGDEVFIMHTVKVPLHDEHGTVSGIIGIALDMTERKAQENQLRQQLDELKRFEKVTIGREERIKQLKDEIQALRNQLK